MPRAASLSYLESIGTGSCSCLVLSKTRSSGRQSAGPEVRTDGQIESEGLP